LRYRQFHKTIKEILILLIMLLITIIIIIIMNMQIKLYTVQFSSPLDD